MNFINKKVPKEFMILYDKEKLLTGLRNCAPTLTRVQLVFFGAEQAVLLYHNPATDFALVKMNHVSNLKTEITVFSEEGKKIFRVTSAEQAI